MKLRTEGTEVTAQCEDTAKMKPMVDVYCSSRHISITIDVEVIVHNSMTALDEAVNSFEVLRNKTHAPSHQRMRHGTTAMVACVAQTLNLQ